MTTSWQETVLLRLQERGYEDVGELLRRNPGRTYAELADELGDVVLPVQLSHLQLEAAKTAGASAFREAMADALVRSLRDQLPNGWSQSSSDPEISQAFKNGLAFSVWRAHLRQFGVAEAITDAVQRAIEEHARVGWLPSSKTDSVIEAAMRKAALAG